MNLLFYISNIGGGGAARVMTNIANALCMDNKIYFVTNFPAEHEYQLDEKIYRYNLESKESAKNAIIKNITRISILRKIIKKEHPDVCLAFMGENNVRLLLATKGINTRKIISIRNDPAKEYPSSRFRKITDFIYRMADCVVFQTEDARNYFSKSIRENSCIIFNQVDEKFYQERSLPGEYILACGRLSKQKNYYMMLDAFRVIVSQYPNEKLKIYGDGSLKDELIEYRDRIGLKFSVDFMGFSSDMVNIYKHAKMLLMTSDYEGMPNVVLEALASSVPVISTDCPCGGPRMVIRDGYNGYLIPVGDTNDLVMRIQEMLYDEASLKEMSINAYESALKFNGEKIIHDWNGIFYDFSRH